MNYVRRLPGLLALALALSSAAPLAAQQPTTTPAAPAGVTGRIGGRVLDRETGRPIAGARVQFSGVPGAIESDLDGRYRSPSLAVGRHTVRAIMIGYAPGLKDSVEVGEGKTALVDFALNPAAVELNEIEVQAQVPAKSDNDAGLLALQQSAPAVSDGISSQAISRSPDANAGEAVKRVTGVTLFDGKFLVVRGLGERYSNALLNGAEMPSAVVEKKVPPLDLFPAGLLDNVIASKTATPDRPGDFAGGSVELVTKDFPEQRLLSFGVSQSFRQGVTFQDVPLSRWHGTDFLGIDDGRRNGPARIPYGGTNYDKETGFRVLQGFRNNVWAPTPREVNPGLGLNFSYGDQKQWDDGRKAFGGIFSLTYNNKAVYTPNRTYNIYNFGSQSAWNVDWGGVFNLAYRPSPSTKIAFRNLYTRAAEERFLSAAGSTPGGTETLVRSYAAQYLERWLWQSQLAGEHGIWGAGLAWKATYGRASINDPDNHGARYETDLEPGGGTSLSGKRIIRRLTDRTWSGQLDITIPFALRRSGDALLKVGGYYRDKHRDFFARDVGIARRIGADPTPLDTIVPGLPPEQAFAPENLGTVFDWVPSANPNDPYIANDRVASAFAMADLPVFSWFRLVGGVRVERWLLNLYPGADNPLGDSYLGKPPILRRDTDPLPSANVTISVTRKLQLRLAGSRTLARPDAREISPGQYSPYGGLGTCTEVGDSTLRRTRIMNGDARLEYYPRGGELFAVSGFVKHFDQPIIEVRTTASAGNGDAECPVQNAREAQVKGLEFEVRKGLDFMGSVFRNIGVGANVTVVDSRIDLTAAQGTITRKFIGQSPFVLNAFLAFEPAAGAFQVSVLYNYFGDRITKYGFNTPASGSGAASATANWVEQGRGTLDAKVRLRLFHGLRTTLAGQNLTRQPITVQEDRNERQIVDRYNPGVTGSFGITYDF